MTMNRNYDWNTVLGAMDLVVRTAKCKSVIVDLEDFFISLRSAKNPFLYTKAVPAALSGAHI